MNNLLWTDLTTDNERAEFIRCGRAAETGIMAAAICDDVADAFAARKEVDRLRAENERAMCQSIVDQQRQVWADAEIERLRAENERLEMLLQMAYCQKIGADAPHGLGCCDNYRGWLSSLQPNA